MAMPRSHTTSTSHGLIFSTSSPYNACASKLSADPDDNVLMDNEGP